MTNPYFRQLPNFQYVDRSYDRSNINDFVNVKNIFKRAKIRDDIFQDLTYFGKYSIVGDQRPDNVAYEVYGDETYDWIVLLSNNILNIQNEWPLSQSAFDDIMLFKYGSYDKLYETFKYETREVKDSLGRVILPSGLSVSKLITDTRKYDETNQENPNYLKKVPYFIEFYDFGLDKDVLYTDITIPISNYEIERRKEDKKRSIFVLKPEYIEVIFTDIERLLGYKKGAPQVLTDTLKKADNIRLFG